LGREGRLRGALERETPLVRSPQAGILFGPIKKQRSTVAGPAGGIRGGNACPYTSQRIYVGAETVTDKNSSPSKFENLTDILLIHSPRVLPSRFLIFAKGWSRMANKKRRAVLFDVIHQDKRFAGKSGAAKPIPITTPLVGQKANPFDFNAFKKTRDARFAARMELLQHLRSMASRWRPVWANIRAKLAPQSPIIAGVLAALVVIASVNTARHFVQRSRGFTSLDDIRLASAHPEVLDVAAIQTAANQPDLNPAAGDPSEPADNASQPAADQIAPTRQINLNYVLVQAYRDESTATEARDFLTTNGIPCTIERGVKNWRKDFYLVIGLQGFVHISGPDYLAYRARIQSLSPDFAGQAPAYRGFAPQAIKWDRGN